MVSVILSDGRVIENAVKLGSEDLDFLKTKGINLTDSMIEFGDKELKDTMLFMEELKNTYKRSNKGSNVYDLSNRNATLQFCKIAPSIPQFANRNEFFERFHKLINDAVAYRFRDEMIQVLVEKNANNIGYRNMPMNNMFIEVFLEFGNIVINGIHLIKVVINPINEEQFYLDVEGKKSPFRCSEDGICVFYTGMDGNNIAFYDYFTLDKTQISGYESRKKTARYTCPICNAPLTDITKTELMCESNSCLGRAKEIGYSVIYDLSSEKARKIFRTQRMKDVWKVEDKIRSFVCNFLDFYTNKEVIIRPLMAESERAGRNEKRSMKGKSYIPSIKIVNVSGYLYKYVNKIKSAFDGDIDLIRKQNWVEGHFRRFFDKETFTVLYGMLRNCRSTEDKIQRLAKNIRVDEDGHPLPLSQQYEWDSAYDVIKEWIMPFIRNKDGIAEDRTTIKVIR